ncbi:MAG: cytochrome P450 [Actinobacteria bacterium]|nr:cytochrome P450 [Actinomycetota bacterium]
MTDRSIHDDNTGNGDDADDPTPYPDATSASDATSAVDPTPGVTATAAPPRTVEPTPDPAAVAGTDGPMDMAGRGEVDLDLHDSGFHERRVAEWARLRETCPVAWNRRHDGYWMVAGHEEVGIAARDGATFSSRYEPEPVDGIDYIGIVGVPRPKRVPKAGIAEVEGPVHLALRRAMNPFMVPRATQELEPLMRRVATWFLDQKIASGAMDLVEDFATPVPSVLTMALVGLPLGDWKRWADLFHGALAHDPAGDAARQTRANLPAMFAQLDEIARDRRANPRDDLATALITMDADGEVLSDDDVRAVLWNLIGGGLDTTASLTSLSLHHLGAHPDQRARLAAEPALLPLATEEFLRFFSVNETLSRTVTCPATLGGRHLSAGDPLVLSWASANRDAAVFDRPDEVVIDRERNPHLAFGVGPHRCIGMHIARTMFQIMVREVLDRIPDYVVDEEATAFYRPNPEVVGMVRMPVTFTPGARIGPPDPPW